MSLILLLALPFVGSAIAALLPSNAKKLEAWLAGLIALTCAILVLTQFSAVQNGQVVRTVIPWLSTLGVDLVLRLDGYSWLFSLIITIMGGLIVLYARYYLSPEDPAPRFF